MRHLRPVAVMGLSLPSPAMDSDPTGLVRSLAQVHAARKAVTSTVQDRGGLWITHTADGLVAHFDAPDVALLAALDGLAALHALDHATAPRHHLAPPRIGLGFGPTLVIPGGGLYGPEVERALALARQVGRGGEVLVSEAMAAALRPMPPGVGLHGAPAARVERAGCSFHVARDHRG